MRLTKGRAVAVCAALGLIAGVGCVTSADVSGRNAIATARYAVTDAENQGAADHAADQLAMAKAKLAEAQKLSKDGLPISARRKADEAEVDAQLAAATARRETARAKLKEAEKVGRDAYELRQGTTDAARERMQ